MPKKRHKPEEIVAKLRQVDVMVSQGQSVADAVRAISVTEVASGRVARWRDLLLAQGGSGRDRKLEAALQHSEAPRIPRVQTAGPGGVRARHVHAGRSAPATNSTVRAGGKVVTPLTSQPDHSMGADHSFWHSDAEGGRPHQQHPTKASKHQKPSCHAGAVHTRPSANFLHPS